VLLLFTLGFHADHVLRRLMMVGNEDVERILIVTAKPVVRAVRQAFHEIASLCDRMYLPTPQLLELPIDDPGTSVAFLYREIKDRSHIVADLSGGMRPVVVVTLLALLLATGRSYVELYVSGEREDAPVARIPLNIFNYVLTKNMSEEKLEILDIVWKVPGLSKHDLAQYLNKSDRTIRAHLSELKRYELIEDRGSKGLHPTTWTKLVLDIFKSE